MCDVSACENMQKTVRVGSSVIYLSYTYRILIIYLPYTYRMLIISTRLDKKNSGEGQQQLTEREMWIKDKFDFFHRAVNHRSKHFRSVSIDVDIGLII